MDDKDKRHDRNFFIGWSDDIPTPDRRFLLMAGFAAVGSSVFAGAKLAAEQGPVGTGSWNMNYTVDLHGRAFAHPYPSLLTQDVGGVLRSIPVVCTNKCGVSAIFEYYQDKPTFVRGTIIKRGTHIMLAVQENEMNWIGKSDRRTDHLVKPEPKYLEHAALNGEILDSKCWTGAMRPAQGKSHKSCATLCIRMGGTPWFIARNGKGKRVIFELTNMAGNEIRYDILPFVADPVRIEGDLVQIADRIQFRTNTDDIKRL